MKYIPSVHLFQTLRIHRPDTFEREIQLAYLRQKLKSQNRKKSFCSVSLNFRAMLRNDMTSVFRTAGFGTGQRGCSIFSDVGSMCIRIEPTELAYPKYPRAGLQCVLRMENHLRGYLCRSLWPETGPVCCFRIERERRRT